MLLLLQITRVPTTTIDSGAVQATGIAAVKAIRVVAMLDQTESLESINFNLKFLNSSNTHSRNPMLVRGR